MKLIISLLLSFMTLSSYGQGDIFGVWETIDDKDGEANSHIEIFRVSDKAHARVLKIFE